MGTRAKPTEPKLCQGARRALGSGLRAAYTEALGAPITDAQVDLLLALRRKERERAPRVRENA